MGWVQAEVQQDKPERSRSSRTLTGNLGSRQRPSSAPAAQGASVTRDPSSIPGDAPYRSYDDAHRACEVHASNHRVRPFLASSASESGSVAPVMAALSWNETTPSLWSGRRNRHNATSQRFYSAVRTIERKRQMPAVSTALRHRVQWRVSA